MYSLETIRILNAKRPQSQTTPAHAKASRIERESSGQKPARPAPAAKAVSPGAR